MATWANSRWTSRPIQRRIPLLLRLEAVTSGSTGGPNDTYGSALTAHPGESQGRPRTNSGSQPIERSPPRPTCVCPQMPLSRTVAPYSSAHRPSPAADPWAQAASTAFHTSYQPVGADLRRDPPADQGHRPTTRRALLPQAGLGRAGSRQPWVARADLHTGGGPPASPPPPRTLH